MKPLESNQIGTDLAPSSEVVLDLKTDISLPIEAESICPDLFQKLSREEIENLPVYYGRRKKQLKDIFHVQGEKSDQLTVNGDLSHFKRIGQSMTRGRISIKGDVGMHLGAYMEGGTILVEGNVSNWVGAHMKGGFIHVKGHAGHFAGAGYVGEKRGVNKGRLLIDGHAGNQTGARMRRGLIVVKGNTGDFTGAHLIAGTIIVLGRLGDMPGPGNKRGTIVALGQAGSILPTYGYQCRHQPVFLRLYSPLFREWGIDYARLTGRFQRYAGDVNTVGKGEILIYDQHE